MGFRERLRDDSGFTLVELMAVLPLALVVAGAALTLLAFSERSHKVTNQRATTLHQQQVGLERMTRELRQATLLVFLSSTLVEFDTYVRVGGGAAERRRVRYDCGTGSRCIRQSGPVGGPVTAATTQLLEGIENVDVFQPRPSIINPSYVAMLVRVRFASDRPLITLRDGVNLRNVSVRG